MRVGRVTGYRHNRTAKNDIVVSRLHRKSVHRSNRPVTVPAVETGAVHFLCHPDRRYKRFTGSHRGIGWSCSICWYVHKLNGRAHIVAVHIHHHRSVDHFDVAWRAIVVPPTACRVTYYSCETTNRLILVGRITESRLARIDNRHTPQHKMRITSALVRYPPIRTLRICVILDDDRSYRNAFGWNVC